MPMTSIDPPLDAFLVIDPQKGFAAPEGSLARAHGWPEVQPLATALQAIAQFVPTLPQQCQLVLIHTQYQPGQFCQDPASPLYQMGVVGANNDCDLVPAISELKFTKQFIKSEHDAYSNREFAQWSRATVAAGARHLLVSGILLEYCVAATVLSCLTDWPRVSLLPALCGSRACKYGGTDSTVSKTLRSLENAGVVSL